MVFACLAIFLAAYLLNILTITIGYHRGLAHKALTLHPRLRALVIHGGSWVTGLDPKAWVVMHRMHHAFSDTPEDPHSPVNAGLFGIGLEQLRSYERVLRGLLKKDPAFTRHATDLEFELSWLNREHVWYLPYLLHASIAVALGAVAGSWILAGAYFFGMMTHPIQGGLVNSFGHAVGGRNFETPDNSRNNHVVAWLVGGEGFQNNHHRYPNSARFSYRSYEIDAGFAAARIFAALGLVTIDAQTLIPPPPERAAALSPATGEN